MQCGRILCEFEILRYKNVNKSHFTCKLLNDAKKIGKNRVCFKTCPEFARFEIGEAFGNAS
jgi:hypothetical protein